MKKRVAFTVYDKDNEKYAKMFKASLRKFHSKEELPLVEVDQTHLDRIQDPYKFYRMTPLISKDLIREYETVIKFDCDQIVTGDISHIWEKGWDAACVNNSNPRELKKVEVKVWDVHPLAYLNAGLVVMHSKKFIDHWMRLCMSDHFNAYQFREQDLMNIMAFYGDWKVRLLDASNNWHGLISKGYWPNVKMKNDDMILPKNDEWPKDEDKVIKVLHWAGGNVDKMNYRISFQSSVIKRLEWLTK